MYKILLVEDDKSIVFNLSEFLKSEGFITEAVSGQKAALRKLDNNKYDLVLLDISLSDGNGFSVYTAIKSRGDIPVIFLTASDDEYSVVTGLDMGAFDYITKPFRPRELISRIRNALRRKEKTVQRFEYGSLMIDPGKGVVYKHNIEINLSALEYRLLLVFLNYAGAVLSRNRLLEELWGIAGEYVNDNTLTVYIKRLRSKIEDDPGNPEIIKTVKGFGYKFGN